MNILVVSAVLPYPLFSGGQVRMYNLLKRLSKKHTITLLSFIRHDEERAYTKELSFCRNVQMVMRGKALQPKYVLGALGNYSLLLSSYDNREMQRLIKKEIDTHRFDLVHIEPFYVYPSLPAMTVPLVVAEHNIEYTVYENYARKFPIPLLRPLAYVDSVKTKVWEEMSWEKARAVIAVSNEDADVIRARTKKPVTVVSNGVDTEFFRYKKHAYARESPTCLFVGNFAWAPNKEAVDRLLTGVWPSIVKTFPHATLTIVGKQFPKQLQQFVTSSVTVKDSVTDIRDAFDANDVLLAPMGIGGGTKFKILEAFASGTSVISTQEGVNGIGAVKDICQIARTTEDFVASMRTLYEKPSQAMKQTQQARKFVEETYNWDAIADIQDAVWRKAI